MNRAQGIRAYAAAGIGDTPAMRLISLLEMIACRDGPFVRQQLAEDAGLPGATLHRMLAQLEGAGFLQRSADGRRYDKAARLRRLAENLMLNSFHHGAPHAVLQQLVAQAGETCNLTTLSGHEVLYLDQVETAAPLRLHLRPGARVPAWCTASGKIFLAQMSPVQRQRLLGHVQRQAHTRHTLTGPEAIEDEVLRAARQGWALDNEEFLAGMQCIAVLVPSPRGRSNLCVAAQAPSTRLSREQAMALLPALQRAAHAIGALAFQGAPSSPDPCH